MLSRLANHRQLYAPSSTLPHHQTQQEGVAASNAHCLGSRRGIATNYLLCPSPPRVFVQLRSVLVSDPVREHSLQILMGRQQPCHLALYPDQTSVCSSYLGNMVSAGPPNTTGLSVPLNAFATRSQYNSAVTSILTKPEF